MTIGEFFMDKERELDALAEILLILTTELKENPTFAIKDAFKYVHREFVTEVLASEAAYYDFFKKTGKDIRKFNWYGGKVSTLNGGQININSEYTAEHMQTGKQFKQELMGAYENGILTKEFIKERWRNRYLCWVTKEEDQRLKRLGYNSDRPDPEKAYREAGITIYRGEVPVNVEKTKKRGAKEKMGEKGRIGEHLTFTNQKVTMKNGTLAYAVYNECGERIGYVFETLDQRTPAYKKAELGFFKEYKNKKYCRFTSQGERISWFYLSERIKKEEQVTLYID